MKTCARCGASFSRRGEVARTVFARQRYCSRQCARQDSAIAAQRKRAETTPAERFLELCIPEPNSGCWLWLGALNGNGYGRFQYGGRVGMAHRAGYEMFVGPIPPGMQANHRCDNVRCVNPEHIWLGTQAANMLDCLSKGRMPLGPQRRSTKLSADQAKDIYRRAFGPESLADIAREYGVRWQSVQSIRNGDSWAHATGARARQAIWLCIRGKADGP